MSDKRHTTEVVIIGGGLAGIVTAIELLDHKKNVILLDKSPQSRFGGMANDAFGGMHLIGTPEQKLNRIKDTPELALADWQQAAEFSDSDYWPQQWAEAYCSRSYEDIYLWLKQRGISFFPIVHWVERGDFKPGNSVPRYHIAWGTGYGLTQTLIKHLEHHANRKQLQLLHEHEVLDFTTHDGEITGCIGTSHGEGFEVSAESTVICAGGINGNLKKVEEYWDTKTYGKMPDNILNGAHPSADGALHDRGKVLGANVTHLEWMWNYAAGIHHPNPEYPKHGLSLIPPRSSLWMDCYGNRVGPDPMVTGFDTHRLCQRVGHLDNQYSWQVMNWKIAIKELAVSGSHINAAFRDKKILPLLKDTLLGNKTLVQNLIDECEDVVIADSLEGLVEQMNALPPASSLQTDVKVDLQTMQRDISAYDQQIERGETYFNDDQLRRIQQLRRWRGDKVRTCRYQKILDSKALPLIAIRSFIISRKSMGGFQTNLNSQVLNRSGTPIPRLYAAGEAAGFGGGGIAGIRSLEGTFLSNCIFNGRIAARSIVSGRLIKGKVNEKDRRVASPVCS